MEHLVEFERGREPVDRIPEPMVVEPCLEQRGSIAGGAELRREQEDM